MLFDLRLQHFRSYQDASFEFSPGVNIIVGPNASGKTNLLEAILVLAKGNSYRVRDAELVAFGAAWSRLDTNLIDGRVRTLKILTEPAVAKNYEIDGKTFKRLTLHHSLPVVLFEPNHLLLLSGGPEQRRVYLDDLLEQTQPAYGALLRQYRRTLAQRNALLKTAQNVSEAQLFPWNIRLSQLAGQVVRARTELVERINVVLPELYTALSHAKTVVSIRYQSQWPVEAYESSMLKKLDATIAIDCMRGFTTSGPHREDFEVLFDGHPASETASRGEVRTLVLGLKIIELQLIGQARDVTPLLLLDDVFSELDGARRKALTEYLRDYQTFITTTDADIVIQHFTETCRLIPLGS